MASRRDKAGLRAALALCIALAAHVAVVGLMCALGALGLLGGPPVPAGFASGNTANATKADGQPMQIENLVDELSQPDVPSAAEKKREEEAKKEEEDKNPHGQVVDLPRPVVQERPDHAKYVSEYDSKVDHQTKAPSSRARAGTASAKPPSPGRDARTAPAAQAQRGAHSAPGRPGPKEATPRKLAAAKHGSHGAAGLLPEQGGREQAGRPGAPGAPAVGMRAPPSVGGQSGAVGHPGRPNLTATPEMLERAIAGGTGSMDYLKNIDDGENTALNSKRWKNAPFFNRIKHAVAEEWHPEVVYLQHDPSGNVYGVKDRVTVLRIHLTPAGKMAAWTVVQSSGVDFLDDEAVGAFKRAQPFPNPPKDLIDPDGQIHFNFAFIFELSGQTSFKVFHYQ